VKPARGIFSDDLACDGGDLGSSLEIQQFPESVVGSLDLPVVRDSLLQLGRRYLRETKAELAKVARKISRTKSWEKLVDEIKRDHPSNAQLVNYYAKEMKRARDFVRQRKLVTMQIGRAHV